MNLNAVKITARDEEVLHLLVLGCSSKEIAGSLKISPRTVKQYLRTLFLRVGISERPGTREVGDRWICEAADGILQPRDQLTAKEKQVTTFWCPRVSRTGRLPQLWDCRAGDQELPTDRIR